MLDADLVNAVEDAFDDGPDPDITGHSLRAVTVTTVDGTAVEDVYIHCLMVPSLDPDLLCRLGREQRIIPPLGSCGRHPEQEH